MQVDHSNNTKKCFYSIQQRRFYAELPAVHLNPSMDIIAVVIQQTGSQLTLHRNFNWQKIATLQSMSSAAAVWRPDGRFLAVSDSSSSSRNNEHEYHGATSAAAVSLYSLEGLLGNDESAKVHSLQLPDAATTTTVTGLSWVHVGNPHPAWKKRNNHDDVDTVNTEWKYRSKYLDDAEHVLPPSEYHHHHHDATRESSAIGNNVVLEPTCQTPLSVLCVATSSGLFLYLHGRYLIACNLPIPDNPNTVVATPDLSHLVIASPQQTACLTMYSIPSLSLHRYDWQTVACEYSNMTLHLQVLRNSVNEILASWKSSLKALDLKLDGLQTLLQKYGLLSAADNDGSSLRKLLVQYILSGHTQSAPDLSNAIDQFFTGVQMNDGLLQRMERSLTSAVANVESTVRRQLLAPAMALNHSAEKLFGLAAASSGPSLLQADGALSLLRTWCRTGVLLSAEAALERIVQARFGLRDLVAWLRSTGAQIKARGTARSSVQRDAARRRRVGDAVVRRMLRYLQHNSDSSTNNNVGTTEVILGLRFADLLRMTTTNDNSPSKTTTQRSISPSSTVQIPGNMETLNVPCAVEKASEIANQVFEHPRSFLAKSICCSEIYLPVVSDSASDRRKAVTTRMGQGGIDLNHVAFGEEPPKGFFSPITVSNDYPKFKGCDIRQWSVVANSVTDNCLQLYAFPLSWAQSGDDLDIDHDCDTAQTGSLVDCYWTTQLELPSDCCVRDIAFYGDDGKSSFSSGVDSGNGQEGRQALGLLVSRRNSSDGEEAADTSEQVELWIVPYDNLSYACLPVKSERQADRLLLRCVAPRHILTSHQVHPMPDDEELVSHLEQGTVYARSRVLSSKVDFTGTENERPCRLELSGSRGIGAVFTNQQGASSLEVFDLEEDEEEEEEEDDDDEEEEEGEEERKLEDMDIESNWVS